MLHFTAVTLCGYKVVAVYSSNLTESLYNYCIQQKTVCHYCTCCFITLQIDFEVVAKIDIKHLNNTFTLMVINSTPFK